MLENQVALPLLIMELVVELYRDIGAAIEEIAVLLDHEVRIQYVAIRLVQRLSLTFLLNFFVNVHWLNCRYDDAVLLSTVGL